MHAEASLKPGRVQGSLSPLDKRMYSPLCFGPGALSLWGHGSCHSLQRPLCPIRTRRGRRCSRKGVSSVHQKGVSFNKRKIPGCWIHLPSPSCSFSGVNGAPGSPKRWAGCQLHTTPSLAQVVFPVLEPGEEAVRGDPRPPSRGACWCGQSWCTLGKPKDIFISPPPM